MGMSSKGGKGQISDINVTPLVDVMLVLLVIFMVTAPLLYNGIELKLPKTTEVNKMNINREQIVLSLSELNKLYLGTKPIAYKDVVDTIKERFKSGGTNILFLRADSNISYGKVAKLMSHLKCRWY